MIRHKRTSPQAIRRKRRNGLSLIEVMIALAILAFGILAAAASQLASMKFNRNSQLQTDAYFLAQQQMETFQQMSANEVDAVIAANNVGDVGTLDPDPNDNLVRAFVRTWTISNNTPEAGLFTINVNVAWVDGLGNSKSVSVESLKVN